jgi:hypothetical protein
MLTAHAVLYYTILYYSTVLYYYTALHMPYRCSCRTVERWRRRHIFLSPLVGACPGAIHRRHRSTPAKEVA